MPSPAIIPSMQVVQRCQIRYSIFLRFARGASSATAPSERVGDRAVSVSQVAFYYRDFRESVTPKLEKRLGYIGPSGKILLQAGRVSPPCRSRDSDRWSHLLILGGYYLLRYSVAALAPPVSYCGQATGGRRNERN